jgi:DNA-binding response OmpR family regulator
MDTNWQPPSTDPKGLFMSRPVDAVVLEYYLGLMDGVAVADEIKHVRPELPIVMLVDHLDLPADTLKSIDALVVKSDGIHFLLATVHFVLKVKPFQSHAAAAVPARPRNTVPSLTDLTAFNHDAPFSPKVWRNIRNGTLQF